jgi:hypothetical protein
VNDLATLRGLLADGNVLSKARGEALKAAIRRGKLCIGTEYVLGRLDAAKAAGSPADAAQIASTALAKAVQKNIALSPCLRAAVDAVKAAGGA